MKSLDEITLYDIMAEDYSVWIKKTSSSYYEIDMENEENEEVIKEPVHAAAINGLAAFCERFLVTFNNANNRAEGVIK